MNIFVLDNDVKLSASYYMDTHVNKILLECAQILCTSLFKNGKEDTPYKPTHMNHPWILYASSSTLAFCWVLEHAKALCVEYEYRFNKRHKSTDIIEFADNIYLYCKFPQRLKRRPLCVSDDCKIPHLGTVNTVESYREYYRKYKRHLAKWTKRDIPHWYE